MGSTIPFVPSSGEPPKASAPGMPPTWVSDYREGPYSYSSKDAFAQIRYSQAGPASNDVKEGTPATTIPQLLELAMKNHGDKVVFQVERIENKETKICEPPSITSDGKVPPPLPLQDWKKWTFEQYYTCSRDVAKSMLSLGVKNFGTVAIWGFNSPEWQMSMMGALMIGAKATGIYPSDTKDTLLYKCQHAQADVLVVDDLNKVEIACSLVRELTHLKAIVLYGSALEDSSKFKEMCKDSSRETQVQVLSWKSFLRISDRKPVNGLDQTFEERKNNVKPGQCAALIYTSGTTGRPKAVMISHDNMAFESSAVNKLVPTFGAKEVKERILSYLPLSHIAGMLVDIIFPIHLAARSKAWFEVSFARPYDLKKGSIKDRLLTVRPTLFVGVPRVWEKIDDKLQAKQEKLGGIKKTLVHTAQSLSMAKAAESQVGKTGKAPTGHWLADKMILQKARAALGLDECKFAISAAAPLGKHTIEHFAGLGISINEIYGMSECTGASTVSTNDCFQWGSCGFALPGTEVCVARPEGDSMVQCRRCKDINNPTEEEQGEILIRGRHVMMGYMANRDYGKDHIKEIAQKNKENIDKDGWLHSGDRGCMDNRGMLRVTGRFKELIIGAGGENVAPVPIESNIKKLCPIISNIMMHGDKKKFNVALVTLKDESIASSEKKLCEKKIPEQIEKAIKETNNNEEVCVSNAAKVRKFTILPHDFAVESGELTSTMKLKRASIADKYNDAIEKMYQSKETYVSCRNGS